MSIPETSPDYQIPSIDTREQDVTPAVPAERVRSGLGVAARSLIEKVKGILSVPADAGIVAGYREPKDTSSRTEAEIIADAGKVGSEGWVHDSTSGRLPKLTPEMIERGDAARAAGESVTDAINETKE